jgi:two-component system, NarL family, nitrate/nitrite response regulator NarL
MEYPEWGTAGEGGVDGPFHVGTPGGIGAVTSPLGENEDPAQRNGVGGRVVILGADAMLVDALSRTLAELGLTLEGRMSRNGRTGDAEAPPDVVLLDADGPHADPASIAAAMPNAKRIWLSARLDADRIRAAIKLGFDGVVSKNVPAHRFESALRSVLNGDVVIETDGESPPASFDPESETARLVFKSLTTREQEILALLVTGATGTEIARRLSLSPHTVRTHVQSIMTKLQVHSRLEAVAFAVHHGLIATNDRPTGEVAS